MRLSFSPIAYLNSFCETLRNGNVVSFHLEYDRNKSTVDIPMNYSHTQLKFKSRHKLLYLQETSGGFTLLELLIVFIIVGILSAIALPNLINQIGKGRETEAKTQLGSIARAQQAYHFEQQVFAATLNELTLTGSFVPQYYDYPEPIAPTPDTRVEHKANAVAADVDRTRNYAVGIYFTTGRYQIVICQGEEVGELSTAPNDPNMDCIDGIKIE